MKADEIRKRGDRFEYKQIACSVAEFQCMMLTEIAAQLAELNEKLDSRINVHQGVQ
jgi:hypothetical protein